jgi:hypothetical protein
MVGVNDRSASSEQSTRVKAAFDFGTGDESNASYKGSEDRLFPTTSEKAEKSGEGRNVPDVQGIWN